MKRLNTLNTNSRNKNDAMKAKKMLDATNLMSFEINDDDITNGELAVDIW